MTLAELVAAENADDSPRYRVSSYPGIAFYFYGPETRADEDTDWTGEETETGRALLVMVGDDRRISIDPDDVSPLDDLAYCAECGQIGCTADGRDRDEEVS